MAQRVTGQRFRQRKLSTKQNLSILRESEVESLADDEAQRHVPRVETGVEKGEETEHHLQAVISASQAAAVGGKVAQLYIPTPEAVRSKIQYEQLYPKVFAQPATYIRFSSTVEDCSGCPYDMDSVDFGFLKSMNQKNGKSHCSENDFEAIMYSFEENARSKQPYAAVSNAPVLSLEEMEDTYDEYMTENARRFIKEVYEHWKARRTARGNQSISPSLRFETNLETDDADPYVCFRRREVRQTRKTRGRDAQSAEKLNSVRYGLEKTRDLVRATVEYHRLQLESLANDKAICIRRKEVRETKRALGVKGDDEDLINQKPVQKPKPKLDSSMVPRGIPGMGLKTPLPRADGRPPDSDLISLQEQKAKREEAIQQFIEDNLTKHQLWNKNYVDITWRPITPPLEQSSKSTFRTAVVEALPTPPASEEGEGEQFQEVESKSRMPNQPEPFVVKYETPQTPPWAMSGKRQCFRRRLGRGGRLMVDRRGIKRTHEEDEEDLLVQRNGVRRVGDGPASNGGVRRQSKRARDNDQMEDRSCAKRQLDFATVQQMQLVKDRYKYDRDSDEDDETYPFDPHDHVHMRFRVLMEKTSGGASLQVRRSQDGHQQTSNHSRSISGQHLAPPS